MSTFKGGVAGAVEILQNLDAASQARLLAELSKRDPQLAEKIAAQLFTFEDLARLPAVDVQALLKEVPQHLLVLALRKASDGLKAQLFSNMSVRASSILKGEIAAQPPQRLADVQKAQADIIAIARRLESEGRLLLKPR